MSQFTVYIDPPAYLAQWLRHEYWDEATGRVVFPRGSAPRAILQSLLRRAPRDWRQGDTTGLLPVEVPTFKGLNPATFCYLSPAGRRSLVSTCKKLFRRVLAEELYMLFDQDVQITDVIYGFMERHGIEATEQNWETIRQMYLRMRKKSRAGGG